MEAPSTPDPRIRQDQVRPAPSAPTVPATLDVGPDPPAAPSTVPETEPPASKPQGSTDVAEPPPLDPISRPSPDLVRVLLGPNLAQVPVGSPVSIVVEIFGASDVASVPFHLRFDASVLKFEGAQEGPALSGDGRQTAFMVALGGPGDRLVVGHSRLGPGSGISGGGRLCTLNFVALGPGNALLAVERASVFDPQGRPAPSVFEVRPLTVH